MDNGRQRIHRLTIHENIQLHQLGGLIIRQLIIERSIASGRGFQLVKIIINNLTERNMINYHYTVHVQIVHALELATLVLGNLHDSTHVILRHNNRSLDKWLLDMVDGGRVRQIRRIVHLHHFPIGFVHMVNNTWSRCDKLQIILTLQALLNNIHVKQSQKSATIAEAQGY